MSLIAALNSGVSALQSYGSSMGVIGNNIANISTIGFKSSRAEFADIFSQVAGGANAIGRGVRLQNVSRSFAQGSFTNTDRLTDLAVDGSGFFILSDGEQRYYTRNGQFQLNQSGFLVNAQGYNVQGQLFDANGTPLGIGNLQFGTTSTPPRATGDGATSGSGVQMSVNLNAQATSIPTTTPFDPTSAITAEATSNFSTSLTVYDSLGGSHQLTVYFKKTDTSTWEWYATVDAAEIDPASTTPGESLYIGASGTLTFDTDGGLQAQTTDPGTDFDFIGAAADQVIGFNFGDDKASGGTGLGGSTQFASPSSVSAQSQDGFAGGSLDSISINRDGTILGFFTNGQNRKIGRIALAQFANVQGLESIGNSLFRQTNKSGVALVGAPTDGGFGGIATFTLELSNVDLAQEFVQLITTQRAYQSNTRIITTVDEMLADVVNVVR